MTIAFLSGVRYTVRRAIWGRGPIASRPAPTQGHLHTRVISEASELGTIEQDWRALHQRSGDTVFQTYEWLATWYRIVEPRLPIRLLTCWNDHQLVGLFPFSIQPINLGILRVNRVRFACEYGVYGEYAPLVDPDFVESCASIVAEYLADELAAGRLDFCDFCNFRAESPVMSKFAEELEKRGLLVSRDATFMPRISILPGATWDDYMKGLRSSHRRELRRDMKALNRPDVTIEVIRDPAAAQSMFEHLIRLHTAAWKRRGAGGHFVTDRHFEKFLRTVTPLLLQQGGATVASVTHNGKPVVVTLEFHSGRYRAAYITGRDLDNNLSTSSPGRTLFGVCIKDAIQRGFTELDYLGGDQQYKMDLGGKMTYYGRLVARKQGAAGLPALIACRLLEARHTMYVKFYLHDVLPKFKKIFRVPKNPAPISSTRHYSSTASGGYQVS